MLKLRSLTFSYRADGKHFTLKTCSSAENSRVSVCILSDEERFDVMLSLRTPVEITHLSAEFEYCFDEDMRIFLNGYQSWTESREYSINETMRGIDHIPAPIREKYAFASYGDYRITEYSRKKGCMHGFSYGYVRNRDDVYDLIASLGEDDGFTVIKTDTAAGTITAEKDCAGYIAEKSYRGLSLYIGKGTEDEVFDRYFELLGIPAPDADRIWGYTSWYRHYQNISKNVIAEDLKGFEGCENAMDVFQIDDGYQTAVGDWLSVDKTKFPDPMEVLSGMIKNAGMTPGIWIAPFVCEEKSQLFREKKDWLVCTDDGDPIKCGGNWSGFYALDIYNKEVQVYIAEVFDTAVNKWGFGLLKLDFLYAACIRPPKNKTRGMVMCDAMELLREYSYGAKILGCGVPLASAFGRVDYCRIGADVSLDWDDKPYMQLMHRERPSTKNTVLNTVFRRQLNGRAFISDPDVFLLRDDDTTMTRRQRQLLCEVNALCGGVLFTSDDNAEYGEWQQSMIGEMKRLQNAKIISAGLYNGTLILTIELDGRVITRVYDHGQSNNTSK